MKEVISNQFLVKPGQQKVLFSCSPDLPTQSSGSEPSRAAVSLGGLKTETEKERTAWPWRARP